MSLQNKNIVTRFAPSPTGFLHIGGARTALFNFLFAKRHGGKFLLRVEDTDQARSTQEAVDCIFSGLKWLGINWDGEVVYQKQRQDVHAKRVEELLKTGNAYYCFSQQDEIEIMRQKAIDHKESFIFHSPWRDVNPDTFPKGMKPVVRLKAPRTGVTEIHDIVQGKITVDNKHLDDMVLLRSDGTPTYMLAVVVDDYDMNITHIIRGDDHLTNAARQILLYKALGWDIPIMCHIPLIHGQDGHKLSKRHGALGVESYKRNYLPEALCNYLLRLGWSHGDDEIIAKEQAIEWFDLEHLGKSPARLDLSKMDHLNAHYIKNYDEESLKQIIINRLTSHLNASSLEISNNDEGDELGTLENIKNLDAGLECRQRFILTDIDLDNITKAIPSIKLRVSTLSELAKLVGPYLHSFIPNIRPDLKEKAFLSSEVKDLIVNTLTNIEDFNKTTIQEALKRISIKQNIKLNELMIPLRIILTGSESFPSAFELISIIGKDIAIQRINS